MSNAEILKAKIYDAANHCLDNHSCTGCPLEGNSRCARFLAFYIRTVKSEPAQAATCTDSEVRNSPNISTSDNTTKTVESQALEAAKKKLLEIYETLTPEECRAWELGEVYAEVVRGIVWGCVE